MKEQRDQNLGGKMRRTFVREASSRLCVRRLPMIVFGLADYGGGQARAATIASTQARAQPYIRNGQGVDRTIDSLEAADYCIKR
jgi:hypothetical protein